jgi:hypothetical protein
VPLMRRKVFTLFAVENDNIVTQKSIQYVWFADRTGFVAKIELYALIGTFVLIVRSAFVLWKYT